MTTQPLISIVTPSYNQGEFLQTTLTSILEQGYPDLETIVIDGGSTDGSLAVIESFADRLSYWVSEPDNGQAEAINKGLARARGEIVAWLNSDDFYLPGTLHAVAETFAAHPEAGLVYADVLAVNASGKRLKTIRYAQYSLADLLRIRIIGQPSVFMRRAVLEKAGLLATEYNYLLDHHLWLRMAAHAEMVYVPKIWAAARYHAEAKNIAQAAGFGAEAYRILEWAGTQPAMQAELNRLGSKAMAGAHRFNARYLLDGGHFVESLRIYRQAFRAYSPEALKHWKRILYAGWKTIFNAKSKID